jgi:ankyrin repeat protein
MRDAKGRTPLHHAVARGYLEVARVLLERNAQMLTPGMTTETPHFSVQLGL